MEQGSRFFTLVTVVIIGFVLQLFLGLMDSRQTPTKVAVAFTKAYFSLDRSMGDYLCDEFTAEDNDVVGTYINNVSDQARTVGFSLNYMRTRLFSVHTEILSESDSEVEIHISGTRKRNINPIFTVIGYIFRLGETHTFDEVLRLVNENGRWKVCGKAFSLSV